MADENKMQPHMPQRPKEKRFNQPPVDVLSFENAANEMLRRPRANHGGALFGGATEPPPKFGMSDDENIYVDASQPATLNDGEVRANTPTLQEAVLAWHRLPPERQQSATISAGGQLYTAATNKSSALRARGRRRNDASRAVSGNSIRRDPSRDPV